MIQPNEKFDLNVKDPGPTSIISMDNRRSLQRFQESTIKMYAHYILSSAVMPKEANQEDRERLSIAGAILKSEYDIDVVAGEAYFIKTSKGYLLDTGYKGMVKAKFRLEERTGKKWIDGETVFFEPDDIVRLGLHLCRKCGGSGEYYQKPCVGCKGAGKFDPKDVHLCEVSTVCVEDALAAKSIGVTYFPPKGSALWQPCDNIPQNRTSMWVAKKNATKDLNRKLFPITISDGSSFEVSNLSQEITDKSTEAVAMLAADYGVEYDDLQSLADFVRNCIFVADWKDEAEVISALASMRIKWEVGISNEIKYRVFGFKAGEYPIGDFVFDSLEPNNGILTMNVILDVGGREKANEISKKLFDGKLCTNGLTRAQLKKIHESVIEDDQ